MRISMATFEHLPVRIGGLAEAVTSLGESLSKSEKVMIFMPAHGLLHDEETNFPTNRKNTVTSNYGRGQDLSCHSLPDGRKGVRIFFFQRGDG